jgi:PAS domain S-box-containing protein
MKDAAELRFVRWNKACEEVVGLPRDQALGKNDHDFFPPEEAAFFSAKDREVLRSGQMLDIPEETIHTAHQGIRVLHTRKVPILDAAGQPQYLLGISEDITEQQQAEAHIRELNQRLTERAAQLEAANQELEAFSYSVSHDLRAPLRAIDGFSQALLEDYHDRLDAAGQDYLGRIRRAAQRMGLLIDDLLGLARVSRTAIKAETVDVSALAQAVLAECRAAEPDRSVDTVVSTGLTTSADPRLLRVALENLLGNAWKFTSRQPQARIEVGAAQQNGLTVFCVRDNGAGFDMTSADRLFGAFQRMHTLDEFPGTGIGLAIVERIIRRHGGRIWAESAAGQGAAFYFVLPNEGSER